MRDVAFTSENRGLFHHALDPFAELGIVLEGAPQCVHQVPELAWLFDVIHVHWQIWYAGHACLLQRGKPLIIDGHNVELEGERGGCRRVARAGLEGPELDGGATELGQRERTEPLRGQRD